MSQPWNQQVEELLENVAVLERSHSGRLVALTLAAPASIAPDKVVERVLARLGALGHGPVDVRAHPSPGPLRLLSVEFAR